MDAGDKTTPTTPADKPQALSAPNPTSTRPKPVQAPAITLPKGGGAIRGIGEKFVSFRRACAAAV